MTSLTELILEIEHIEARLDWVSKRLRETHNTQFEADSSYDAAWQVIADVRDAHKRVVDDASTDEIVQALIRAGLLTNGAGL